MDDFIEYVADFYGTFTVDEFAERLGVSTIELIEMIDDLIELNYDDISEEISYNDEEEDEEED